MGKEYTGKFWFDGSLPKEVLESCRDIFLANEDLIPEWCHEVIIKWDSDADNNSDETISAYVVTSYCYRNATIHLCPQFLSALPEVKQTIIQHELFHIVSQPLIEYVKDVVGIMTKDDKVLKKIIWHQISEKMESMTEDLTNILKKIITK